MFVPFVGRRREIDWLRARLEVPDGLDVGTALLVVGEAGVGKTRLVAEAVERSRVLLWIGFPGGRVTSPGYGLHRLSELGGPEADALRAELAQPDRAPGGWKLAALCSAANKALKAQVQAPGVAVFDDVQWADDMTLTWLSHVADLLQEVPLVLLLVARGVGPLPAKLSEALAPLSRKRRLETLDVGSLDVAEVGMMTQAAGFDPDVNLEARVHDLTGGLPLAVEELLRSFDQPHEIPDARGWVQAIADAPVPSVLRELVGEQLDELEPDARTLLAITALAPQPASEAIVKRTASLSDGRFDRALEAALETTLLLRTPQGMLAFRHELHREALQQQLLLSERRGMHRRLAMILQQQPEPQAGPIAQQLIDAGEMGEATDWLERAGDEAVTSHDHGMALTHFVDAFELRLDGSGKATARIAEKAERAARYSNQPETAFVLVDRALQRHLEPRARGRLLMCHARLEVLESDFDGEIKDLQAARVAFAEAGDARGHALALGALAIPTGSLLPLKERIALGRKGLMLAERARDAMAVAVCAGNLATAELSAGNPEAFGLWAKAVRAIDPAVSAEMAREACRNLANWAIGALHYGSYEQAGSVIEESIALCTERVRDSRWERALRALASLRLWRLGRWDEALLQAEQVRDAREADVELARCVEVAIGFERDRSPDVTSLQHTTEVLLRHSEYGWASIAQSILMRARAARREPRPARGLSELVAEIGVSEVRDGWDDLLPAAAAVEPEEYRRMMAILRDFRPMGLRAEASKALAEGLMAAATRPHDAEILLLDAVAAYNAIEEPYAVAHCLAAASRARTLQGKPMEDTAIRAAEIYQRLGAHRSLSMLLRTLPRRRAFERFRPAAGLVSFRHWRLTGREREVTDLARHGYTAQAISETLGISVRTVEKHIERVKSKLGAARKSDLVRLFPSA